MEGDEKIDKETPKEEPEALENAEDTEIKDEPTGGDQEDQEEPEGAKPTEAGEESEKAAKPSKPKRGGSRRSRKRRGGNRSSTGTPQAQVSKEASELQPPDEGEIEVTGQTEKLNEEAEEDSEVKKEPSENDTSETREREPSPVVTRRSNRKLQQIKVVIADFIKQF